MSYRREIPRDLFNEAKLLKCLGQLALKLKYDPTSRWPTEIWHVTQCDDDEEDDITRPGFEIRQRPDDGSIYCDNLEVKCCGHVLGFYSPLNSRQPYPLVCSRPDGEDAVFTDDGALSPEFIRFLDTLAAK